MTVVLLVCAAVSGVVVGWFLTGVARRVPAVTPMRYPILLLVTPFAYVVVTWWLLATGSAAAPYPVPVLWVVLVAYLYFASLSIVLTVIDVEVHRLPNGIVLPAYPITVIVFIVACLLGAPWASLLSAGIGMLTLYAFYFLVRLVSPRGMGGGDVKLAGVIGLFLGWSGWAALAVGAFTAFALGGVFGLLLVASGRAGRKTAIPFGPWMIAGAWVGLFAGESIGRLYLGVSS